VVKEQQGPDRYYEGTVEAAALAAFGDRVEPWVTWAINALRFCAPETGAFLLYVYL